MGVLIENKSGRKNRETSRREKRERESSLAA
jgi:hypothetical protein